MYRCCILVLYVFELYQWIWKWHIPGIILGIGSANERWRNMYETSSLAEPMHRMIPDVQVLCHRIIMCNVHKVLLYWALFECNDNLSKNRDSHLNTLRQRQNGCHFPDDTFKCIFLNENTKCIYISINISLKFVPKVPINHIPTLVSIMAWRRPGDKPLSEPMMVRLPTHICVKSCVRTGLTAWRLTKLIIFGWCPLQWKT